MSFKYMRNVDRYVGSLLFLVLFPLLVLSNLLRSKDVSPRTVKTIVVLKFLGAGSIINALPLLKQLRSRYPNAKLIFMTFSSQEPLVRIFDEVDDIIVINESNTSLFVVTTVRAVFLALLKVPDICIDLEFFSRYSMIISFLTSARVRAGFFAWNTIRSCFLTHPMSFNHYVHVSQTYLALGEPLGLPNCSEEAVIRLPSLFDRYKETLDQKIGGDPAKSIIAVNVSASELSTLRAWPIENFAHVINALMSRYPDYRYVLIGTASQKQRVDNVMELVAQAESHIVNLAGKTSFYEFMALMEISSLVLTSDGGAAHVASGYNTPLVVMFGPETPLLYRPLSAKAAVLYDPPYCSPCINVLDNKKGVTCLSPECLIRISPEKALQACCGWLDESELPPQSSGPLPVGRGI